MSYWQLFYHIITATKNREPLITPQIESILFQHMRIKAQELDCNVLAINGTEDHVHLVVEIPPKLAVATFVGQVKGFSSTQFNHHHPQLAPFFWQLEYGVFSFDKKRLPGFIQYVESQKDHHRQGSLIPALERWEDQHKQIREEPGEYEINL